MGLFNEFLKKKPNLDELLQGRKKLINKIQGETDRKLLIYASDLDFKGDTRDTLISAEDRTPFVELIESIKIGSNIDVLIESPGGYAEIVEDFVHLLRQRFKSLRFIVPNIAKSAATIMAMGGDAILLDHRSTLGPIDAQINSKGKSFAAQAFLQGLQNIIEDSENNHKLKLAHIPILQNISPGEIQACEDADRLARTLVSKWLREYMFIDLSDEEASRKAKHIALQLCSRSEWLSHNRSIRIKELQGWDVKVIDYGQYNKLSKYIWDLWVHIFWTFKSNIFKLLESENINIYRQVNVRNPKPLNLPPDEAIRRAESINIDSACPKCGEKTKFFLKFKKQAKTLDSEVEDYPNDDRYLCKNCGANIDLSPLRLDMERLKGEKAILL